MEEAIGEEVITVEVAETGMVVVRAVAAGIGVVVVKGVVAVTADFVPSVVAWCTNRSPVASSLASRVSADPNSDRHAKGRHPVEDVAPDFCLGLLIGQSPSVKPPADNGLVAIYCGLGQASAIIAGAALPTHATRF